MRTATAQAFTTDDTQFFIDCLTGPVQHDEHCKGWRFHFYMIDSERRFQAVMTEAHKLAAERKIGEKIITDFVYPPIPDRRFDWSAVTDNYDGAEDSHCPIGYGPTEREAINDLLAEIEDRAS